MNTETFTAPDAFARMTRLDDVTAVLSQIEAAEAAITDAGQRHPHAANRLYHSFELLVPTHERMSANVVYAAHCRELLDRVARGEDTRPGTAVEVCCALLHVSETAPLTSAATGLYMRMWLAAGLTDIAEIASSSEHHEALESSRIDDHERLSRRKLTVADRLLGDIECHGFHHGQLVTCVYAPNRAPAPSDAAPGEPHAS